MKKDINTFKAYGGCYPIRGEGAVEGAKLGAKAVIIRSLASGIDEHPHTGSMHYEENVSKNTCRSHFHQRLRVDCKFKRYNRVHFRNGLQKFPG
jgi:hypothetical protein